MLSGFCGHLSSLRDNCGRAVLHTFFSLPAFLAPFWGLMRSFKGVFVGGRGGLAFFPFPSPRSFFVWHFLRRYLRVFLGCVFYVW